MYVNTLRIVSQAMGDCAGRTLVKAFFTPGKLDARYPVGPRLQVSATITAEPVLKRPGEFLMRLDWASYEAAKDLHGRTLSIGGHEWRVVCDL